MAGTVVGKEGLIVSCGGGCGGIREVTKVQRRSDRHHVILHLTGTAESRRRGTGVGGGPETHPHVGIKHRSQRNREIYVQGAARAAIGDQHINGNLFSGIRK